MVMVARRCLLLSCLLAAAPSLAAVITQVDRLDIEANESFELKVTSDSIADVTQQPDVSVLEQDFFVGQGNRLSNTTIVNGQMRRSMTWTYVLMPRRAGRLTIPPISVGGEQSEPLSITVSEASSAPPGEAEVFITSEVDDTETYVQAQVLLTIKVYRSVAVRQPLVRDPSVSGVEILSELAGDERHYDAVINGTAYDVTERIYALYPQESGTLAISPARYEARVLRDGRITGRKTFESEAQSVTVLPIPPRPAEYPDAAWLPARDVAIVEDWSRDADEIKAGEPLTRHVTISALGQLETQIPAPDAPTIEGINVYPDKPALGRRIESGGIRGVRRDQYAMIGVVDGTVTLPALELPWWNTDTSKWQVARLPERSIVILPSGEAPLPEPQVEAGADTNATSSGTAFNLPANFWRRATELLAALWLVTLLVWWWTSRPQQRQQRTPAPVPIHQRQSRLLKDARKAARAGDAMAAKTALLDWGALEWPDEAPRNIGTLATRVSDDLANELTTLSRLSYGPESGEFDGQALASAIRSFSVLKDESKSSDDPLPPLMPQS